MSKWRPCTRMILDSFVLLTSSPLSPIGPGNPLSPLTPCRKVNQVNVIGEVRTSESFFLLLHKTQIHLTQFGCIHGNSIHGEPIQ